MFHLQNRNKDRENRFIFIIIAQKSPENSLKQETNGTLFSFRMQEPFTREQSAGKKYAKGRVPCKMHPVLWNSACRRKPENRHSLMAPSIIPLTKYF